MCLMNNPYFELNIKYEDGSESDISAYIDVKLTKRDLHNFFTHILDNSEYIHGFTPSDEFESISLKNYRKIVIKIYDANGQEIRF